MNPREAHDVYDLPTILAELHPEAIKTACHEYMENVVHVGDVQIVTEKYRELKGLCEEEFNILSARAATEARTAAARAQRLVAAMGGKGLGTGPTFRRPSVSVSGVLDSPGPNGRRVSFGGSALDGPLFKEPDARPEFVPDSPSPTRPLLLGALDEDGVPSRTPSTSGRATGRHAAPSSHAAYHGDGELRLPMIDRGMLNPGTRRFIDEDAPSLASSSALLGALTPVKACHGGAQRPGLLDTFSTQTSPTMAKAHDVATRVGRMGREGGRSQSDFGHSGMGPGPGMGYQGTFLAPRPSALMSIWYPEAGTAPAKHDNRAAPAAVTALLHEEGGEKLAALVSSWDKAAAAKPPQRGVFKELTSGDESVVRLGR